MQWGLLVEFSCNPHSLLDSPTESFTACEIICPWVTSGCYNRKGKHFLDLVDDNLNIIELVYTKEGP